MALPIYPVKGYSITLQIADPARAPVSTLLDETYKIAITRLGDRIRVGGMAEVSGYNPSLPLRRQETLLKCVGEHFPSSFATGRYDFWSGMRPMTPDGTPIVGRAGSPNLFINSGHGTLGWTMACGSGKLVADLLDGRPTDIESADLGPSRYGTPRSLPSSYRR
jgi:D-amino-acid dehydrogenase